jgi:hypothetical protein
MFIDMDMASGNQSLHSVPAGWLFTCRIFFGSLPAGDFNFIFFVETNPNGGLNSPLYSNFVRVRVED